MSILPENDIFKQLANKILKYKLEFPTRQRTKVRVMRNMMRTNQ